MTTSPLLCHVTTTSTARHDQQVSYLTGVVTALVLGDRDGDELIVQ